MKRVNLSVNLEDSEALASEVKDLVLAQARQISREVLNEELVYETNRIVEAKVKSLKTASSWSDVYQNIVKNVSITMEQKLKNDGTLDAIIDKLLEEKIEALVEKRLKKDVNLDGIIENYLNKSIASALLRMSDGDSLKP